MNTEKNSLVINTSFEVTPQNSDGAWKLCQARRQQNPNHHFRWAIQNIDPQIQRVDLKHFNKKKAEIKK
jgi:ribosomal protein S7